VRFVRGERQAELVFGFEFVLGLHRVGGDAEDFRARFPERGFEPREVDRLFGATRRVGSGKK
jgi:hypothetical protein